MFGIVILVVLLLLLFGSFPMWPHTVGWGYGPSGGLGMVLIIVFILILMGKL